MVHGAVVHEVHPRVQRGAGGSARDGLGPVVAEKHALGGQTIKIGCLHQRVADGPQRVAAPLIGGDKKNVAAHDKIWERFGQCRPDAM